MGPQTFSLFVIIMQTKTGAFLSMGRIPQYIGQAALAASVFAGGASLLNAGGAMAQSVFPPRPPLDSPSVGGVFIDYLSGPSLGDGDVEFNLVAPKTVTIDTDFQPNLNTGGVLGTFTYSLTAPAGEYWTSYALTSLMVPGFGGATFTKQVCTNSNFTNCASPLSTTNTASDPIDGVSLAALNLGTPNVIYVRDTYTTTNGTALIDNYSNTFQHVPGPLPILGAGAAFGFSRKLRGRIKAARLG